MKAAAAAAWLGYTGLLWVLTTRPVVLPPGIPGNDKTHHTAAFALHAALTVALLRAAGAPRDRAVSAGALTAVVYGVLVEVAQAFTPNRSPELLDALADALGAGLVWLALTALWVRRG